MRRRRTGTQLNPQNRASLFVRAQNEVPDCYRRRPGNRRAGGVEPVCSACVLSTSVSAPSPLTLSRSASLVSLSLLQLGSRVLRSQDFKFSILCYTTV